jgi:uncharacterized lipoprotein YajG
MNQLHRTRALFVAVGLTLLAGCETEVAPTTRTTTTTETTTVRTPSASEVLSSPTSTTETTRVMPDGTTETRTSVE